MEMGGIDGELVESWSMDDEMALPLVRLWCEVLEDRNPMYHDADYAAKSRHRGIVAPGPMLLPLTTRPEWTPAGSISSTSQGLSQEYPEYPHAASLSTVQYYHRPIRLGERPRIHWFQGPASEETMTERGAGLIIPRYFSFRDTNDEEIADTASINCAIGTCRTPNPRLRRARCRAARRHRSRSRSRVRGATSRSATCWRPSRCR